MRLPACMPSVLPAASWVERAAVWALFVRLALANVCDVLAKEHPTTRCIDFKRLPATVKLKHPKASKRSKDMASHERQVTLHVYTFAGVGGRTNSILSSLSLGLHHSGVEVSGREFSFNDGGVFQTRPHECTRGDEPQCVLKESKFLGVHVGSTNEFNGVLNELRRAFPPGSYSLTGKNCNHFADAFCRALIGCGIPSYVNRAASYGRWLNFGNKGYQIGDGASSEAPKAKPAKADPNRSKKKELTEHQKMLLERIRNGATDKT